jgi:putative OPT family oligopeptide transporter
MAVSIDDRTIAAERSLPELTLRGLILGALITVVFTASNVYLGLKVGLTFSSSIPAAVISMAILRFVRGANILENNMVQTQASAAGTLSSIIFIVPALVMIGHWQGFPFWQTAGICMIGGILGVMYTIPLRRAMVVLTDLPYPEGMAAAEILRVGSPDESKPRHVPNPGERAEPGLRDIVLGAIVAAAANLSAGSGLQLIADEASWWLTLGGSVLRLSTGFSLALMGAGYLVGIVVGIAMLVGVVIAWGIAVPILTAMTPMPEGTSVAAFAGGIWSHQVRFIGAGTIAVAAIWTLVILMRPMAEGVRSALVAMREIRAGHGDLIPRTDRDIPIHWVAGISLALVVPMAAILAYFLSETGVALGSGLFWGLVAYGVVFAFVIGFIIAAACGYMAGLVGSTNSPISGIGIIGTTLVSLLLLAMLGGSGGLLSTDAGTKMAIALAIFITSVVVATACIANDNLQDLKTGQLVGATPWRQQVALVVGVVVGSLVIPPILDLLYQAYGFAGALPHAGMSADQALSAPQATLMTAIAQGIFTHQLNWTMVLIGVATGVALILIDDLLRRRALKTGGKARLPVLAVGIGIYLPPAVTVTISLGALIGWLTDRALHRHAVATGADFKAFAERPQRRGVLFASGLIVGESLMGVLIAGIIGATGNQAPLALVGPGFAPIAEFLGLAVFILVGWGFYRHVLAGERNAGNRANARG